MYIKIQKVNNRLLNKSLVYFSKDFINSLKLKSTFNESLVARYLIEKNKNNYYSISHKNNLVFIWTNDNKIWLDIEILKSREFSLLNKFGDEEYQLLWWKKWKYFYILWTAKESIIKIENLKLDDIWKIKLKKIENTEIKICDINFQKKLYLQYKEKEFLVFNWFEWDICYSITK